MAILAFDTTMAACSAAVSERGRLLASRYELMQKGHAERLLPMIEAVMAEAGLDFSAIDQLRVTRGPGTFTGIRVGIAAARGLALALGLPIGAFNSLAAIAHHFCHQQRGALEDGPLTIVTDARRGEVYLQDFVIRDGKPVAQSEPQALSPAKAVWRYEGRGARMVGNGAPLLAAAANCERGLDLGEEGELEILAQDGLPNAAAFVTLPDSQLMFSSQPVEPLYLRAPDAKPQTAKQIVRASQLLAP